jgi:hypothetical protein
MHILSEHTLHEIHHLTTPHSMLMMMRRPEFLMMRRPEFLMMRRPALP